MNSSAVCEWPLSREWTQINYPSHDGDTTQCTPGGLPPNQDHTLQHNFTLPTKEDLVSYFFKHFGPMRLGLNIHSTSIQNHKSWAGLLTDDRKTQPIPSRSS